MEEVKFKYISNDDRYVEKYFIKSTDVPDNDVLEIPFSKVEVQFISAILASCATHTNYVKMVISPLSRVA
jgi:hypothetical protein